MSLIERELTDEEEALVWGEPEPSSGNKESFSYGGKGRGFPPLFVAVTGFVAVDVMRMATVTIIAATIISGHHSLFLLIGMASLPPRHLRLYFVVFCHSGSICVCVYVCVCVSLCVCVCSK